MIYPLVQPLLFVIFMWAVLFVAVYVIINLPLSKLDQLIKSYRKKTVPGDTAITVTAIMLFLVGLMGFAGAISWLNFLAPEFIGLALTILIIDRLYAFRAEQTEKTQVIRQLASHSNEFALEAVRIAREQGWISDGTLRGANLQKANLVGADLSLADLQRVNLHGAKLQRTWLSHESDGYWLHSQMLPFFLLSDELQGANLAKAYLGRADLTNAIMVKAYLEEANLEYALLDHASLQGANLRGANLWMTILVETNLCGADLSGSSLIHARILSAEYDDCTIWPENFKPDASRLKYRGRCPQSHLLEQSSQG